MKFILRLTVVGVLIILVLYTVFKAQVDDRFDQYGVATYVKHRVKTTFKDGTLDYLPPLPGITGDKVIVMAKVEKENTQWVTEELSDWLSAIYTVDSTSTDPATLKTPTNKGREAMAYLTYIIDNYARLPAVIAFLHPHKDGFLSSWHTDTPLHSNVEAMRMLNLSYIMDKGYANLRCKHSPGCLAKDLNNAHVTPEVYQDVFQGTMNEVKNVASAPKQVGAACCAQFAVSKQQVLKRPLHDYERLRQWLLYTEQSDAKSGRVMEFLWHMIFGMNAIHCPREEECYCNVYKQCSTKLNGEKAAPSPPDTHGHD